jgi:site-specific DNA-methyltransferase (adenine-specific)
MDGSTKFVDREEKAPATPDAERWQGWGTALKPAHEPIVVARKPLNGTVAGNVLRHGTGALNIDGCRVESDGSHKVTGTVTKRTTVAGDERTGKALGMYGAGASFTPTNHEGGRWPANVILDEDQAAALDQQSGQFAGVASGMRQVEGPVTFTVGEAIPPKRFERGIADFGGASRFFYVAKADSAERPLVNGTAHPTVKPLALMRWLVRLVTPPGGTVLEPFAGSGTTVEACVLEGFKCIAIEREAEYLPLITSRLQQGTFDFGEGA